MAETLTLQTFTDRQWRDAAHLRLPERLASRGMPESLIDRPTIGLDRVTERLNKWGLLV